MKRNLENINLELKNRLNGELAYQLDYFLFSNGFLYEVKLEAKELYNGERGVYLTKRTNELYAIINRQFNPMDTIHDTLGSLNDGLIDSLVAIGYEDPYSITVKFPASSDTKWTVVQPDPNDLPF